jgi:hypothetical protein
VTSTIERMARAAYEKHPLRKVTFRDNVISAPAWDELDSFEKETVLNAQRAALDAMIDALRVEVVKETRGSRHGALNTS